MSTAYDLERAFYLSQLPGYSTNTPLIDLKKAYYSINSNSRAVPVFPGTKVLDTVDEVVSQRTEAEMIANPTYIFDFTGEDSADYVYDPKVRILRMVKRQTDPLVVMLKQDDGDNRWMELGGASGHTDVPGTMENWKYVRSLGISVTLSIISSLATAGTGNTLTYAQLFVLAMEAGFEIASHSMYHQSADSYTNGYDGFYAAGSEMVTNEIVNSKIDIEAGLAAIKNPAQKIGVNGFVAPGGWTGASKLSGYDKSVGILGTSIKDNYKWSQAYGVGPQHFVSSFLVNENPHGPILTNVTNLIESQFSGSLNNKMLCGLSILFHGLPTDLKATCDYLKSLVDLGKIILVSGSQFHNILVNGFPKHTYLPYGNIDKWTTDFSLVNNGTVGPFTIKSANSTGTVVEDSVTKRKWLHWTTAAAGVEAGIRINFNMLREDIQGVPITVRFKAKSGAAPSSIKISRYGSQTQEYIGETYTLSNVEKIITIQCTPARCDDTTNYGRLALISNSANAEVFIKDIELF